MTTFSDLLASSKLPERSVPICLRGDLVAQHEELARQLKAAQDGARDSLDAGADVGALAERVEDLEAEMRAATYGFRLRALPRPKFRELINQHPPRRNDDDGKVDERDVYVGVNTDTFYDALIRRCVVDPDLPEGQWRELLEERLTDQQYDALARAAWGINRSEVDIPFSRAASLLSRRTGAE